MKMAAKPKYEQLSEKYPNTIVLQVRGKFYNAFSDSAKILSEVFGYNLAETEKGTLTTGFPIEGSENKFEYLKGQKISFVAVNKEEIVEQYDAATENRYQSLFENVKEKSADKTITSSEKSIGEPDGSDHKEFVLLDSIRTRLDQFCLDRKDFSPDTCFNLVLDEGLRKWGY